MIDRDTEARFATHPHTQMNTIRVLSGASYALLNGLAHCAEDTVDRWTGHPAQRVAGMYCALAACRYTNPDGPITLVVEDMLLHEQPWPHRDDAIALLEEVQCADFTQCDPPHPVHRVMKWHQLFELADYAIRALGPPRPLAVTLEQHLDALGSLD